MKVLITGASRGIGLGIAKELHKVGHHILLVARSLELLDGIKKQLGWRCDVFCYDLLQEYSVKECYDELSDMDLMPEVLIHNLGGRLQQDVQPLDIKTLHKSIDFNLGVAVRFNHLFIPYMQKRGGGYILHISSDSAVNGNGAPGYVAAKAGLNSYIKSTARFFAKDNIIINGIMPGIIDFEGGTWDKKKVNEPEKYNKAKNAQSLGRFGTVEEVSLFVRDLIQSHNMLTNGEIFLLTGGGGH